MSKNGQVPGIGEKPVTGAVACHDRGDMRWLALGLCSMALVVAAGCHPERKKDDGLVTIRVRVIGGGQVAQLDIGRWCEHWCSYRVARGTPVRFRAVPQEDLFARWTGPCSGGPDCFFAPLDDVTLVARFGPDDPGLPWYRPLWAR